MGRMEVSQRLTLLSVCLDLDSRQFHVLFPSAFMNLDLSFRANAWANALEVPESKEKDTNRNTGW